MKIWIHTNGVQEGPFEIEELPLDRIDAQTPIWYEGLPDWMPVCQAPATAHLFNMEPDSAAMADAIDRAAKREREFDSADYKDVAANRAVADEEARSGKVLASEDEPASYLGWSIVMTALCCNPLAIVAIITGAGVRSKCNARDYDGARRLSEVTAWLVMISIVLSLMFLPVAMIVM